MKPSVLTGALLIFVVMALEGVAAVAEKSDPVVAAASAADVGMTKEAAIEACGPSGERAYLNRLRCTDGSKVRFERQGSVGFRHDAKTEEQQREIEKQGWGLDPLPPGATDYHMIDAYEVSCPGKKVVLYLDLYHCRAPKPQGVPPGFTMKGQKEKK